MRPLPYGTSSLGEWAMPPRVAALGGNYLSVFYRPFIFNGICPVRG